MKCVILFITCTFIFYRCSTKSIQMGRKMFLDSEQSECIDCTMMYGLSPVANHWCVIEVKCKNSSSHKKRRENHKKVMEKREHYTILFYAEMSILNSQYLFISVLGQIFTKLVCQNNKNLQKNDYYKVKIIGNSLQSWFSKIIRVHMNHFFITVCSRKIVLIRFYAIMILLPLPVNYGHTKNYVARFPALHDARKR
ncbi:hypothetical protein AGLY_018357 [Aphis glycines]|uniref:Uncharacterized protein n=1 Tax=Aphis glycines TaxID=307491 RepID=A0A6G0ST19_APHGL|nr:hypothetical protein AGLY_018357 [Aphis glycines]